MQMPHTVPRLRARAQRALPRALLRAPPQRPRSRPAPQTVRCSCMPLSSLIAQALLTDRTPAMLACRTCDCSFCIWQAAVQPCSPKSLPSLLLTRLAAAAIHVVMHAMTNEACCPGSSAQDDPEQRTPGAEFVGDGHVGQESAAPKRRRDIKDQRGDSLTKPYIPFSAGPRDCLGQRLGMTYVSRHTDQVCQKDSIASLASAAILKIQS